VLDALEELAEKDAEKYARFWKTFGAVMKEGPAEDYANRDRIAALLRFASTHTDRPDQDVSLRDYVARMKEGQDKIYYITAESFAAADHSPHLELLRKKGVEVLLLYERVDEWLVSHLTEFDGKPLQSVAKGDLDLSALEDQEERRSAEQAEADYKDLLERMRGVLGERVKDVRVSRRLTDSPACLVLDEHDMSVHLQRVLKAAGHEVPAGKPVLEVNPGHPLVRRLKAESDQARFSDWTLILFDQALLADGGQLEDPAAFVGRLNDLLLRLSLQ